MQVLYTLGHCERPVLPSNRVSQCTDVGVSFPHSRHDRVCVVRCVRHVFLMSEYQNVDRFPMGGVTQEHTEKTA